MAVVWGTRVTKAFVCRSSGELPWNDRSEIRTRVDSKESQIASCYIPF